MGPKGQKCFKNDNDKLLQEARKHFRHEIRWQCLLEKRKVELMVMVCVCNYEGSTLTKQYLISQLPDNKHLYKPLRLLVHILLSN